MSRQGHCQGCCQCYIYCHLCSSVYNITDGPEFKMRQLSMQDYQKEFFWQESWREDWQEVWQEVWREVDKKVD